MKSFIDEYFESILEQIKGDENDAGIHGMDVRTRRRLKVGRLKKLKKEPKPKLPERSKEPYSMARVTRFQNEEEDGMSRRAIVDYMNERQKTDAALAFPGEDKKSRPGAFKVSSKALAAWKEQPGIHSLNDVMSKQQKAVLSGISKSRLGRIFGSENDEELKYAKGVIYRSHPKKTMEMFLKNAGKADPALARFIRAHPESIPVLFHYVIATISGWQVAKGIMKKYFMTNPSQEQHKKTRKEGFEMSKLRERGYVNLVEDNEEISEERTFKDDREKVSVSNLENYLVNMEKALKQAMTSLAQWKSSDRMTPQMGNVKQMLMVIQAGSRRALHRIEKSGLDK